MEVKLDVSQFLDENEQQTDGPEKQEKKKKVSSNLYGLEMQM